MAALCIYSLALIRSIHSHIENKNNRETATGHRGQELRLRATIVTISSSLSTNYIFHSVVLIKLSVQL